MDRFRKNYSDCFSLAVIPFVIIAFIMMNDSGTTAALRWLAVVFCVTYFIGRMIPFSNMSFPDEGFGIKFSLGLFMSFFVSWSVCAITKAEFGNTAVFTSFAVLAVATFLVKKYAVRTVYATADETIRLLRGFSVFAVIFLVVFWAIGFNPVVDPGTENYMDFGFMQTIFRQKSALPFDLWFATEKLNYYYLGQAAAVYMCRLAFTTPEYGYNMMLATFTAIVFLGVFEIVYALFVRLPRSGENVRPYALAGGGVGAFTAAFSANPHWLVYGFIRPLLQKIFSGEDAKRYWFCDGTVFIRPQLGDADNGKNEFPAYSFILGDLHAHVINVIFVLPLIALLLDYCLEKDDDKKTEMSRFWKLIPIACLLGYYKGANYWDFAIYYVICGGLIVFSDLKRSKACVKTFERIGIKAAVVTIVSAVIILPFSLNFTKMESGVALCETHTSAYKFGVLWFLPIAVTLWLITALYVNDDTEKICRVSLLALMLCTIGLVIVPEVVYVKDIYGSENSRFNTMFKLTYQAFILFAIIFGIAFAYMLMRYFLSGNRSFSKAAMIVLFVLYTVYSCSYSVYASKQWLGIGQPGKRIGISSLEGLRGDETYGFEIEAADVIAKDPRKVINIVEAAGNSYTHESALSVYTGACTPAGWFVHEWMWHNDPEPVRERADRVAYFYTSGDSEYCRNFLNRYAIDYIFVGPAEVCKYPVNYGGFESFGEVVAATVWQDRTLVLIKVDPALIK